jgi:hypothetical protein
MTDTEAKITRSLIYTDGEMDLLKAALADNFNTFCTREGINRQAANIPAEQGILFVFVADADTSTVLMNRFAVPRNFRL